MAKFILTLRASGSTQCVGSRRTRRPGASSAATAFDSLCARHGCGDGPTVYLLHSAFRLPVRRSGANRKQPRMSNRGAVPCGRANSQPEMAQIRVHERCCEGGHRLLGGRTAARGRARDVLPVRQSSCSKDDHCRCPWSSPVVKTTDSIRAAKPESIRFAKHNQYQVNAVEDCSATPMATVVGQSHEVSVSPACDAVSLWRVQNPPASG